MKTTTKLVIATMSLMLATSTGYAMSEKFNDYSQVPDWAKSAVNNLSASGIINGYENGNFGPNDNVSRAQLATILDRQQTKYANILMNYGYFQDTNLDYEVQTALALAIAGYGAAEAPRESNDYALGASCNFQNSSLQDYGMIKKINSAEIPSSYHVYNCSGDKNYGGGYYVHHSYTGGIPGSGTTATIDKWYGPFAANTLLSN